MFRGRLDLWVPLSLALAVFLVRLGDGPLVERLRNRVFDAYQRQGFRDYEDVGVRVVDLDNETLARLGQWPWPRSLTARLIAKIAASGASVVASDIVFAGTDESAPAALAARLPEGPGWEPVRRRILQLPDHDQALVAAIRKTRFVAGSLLTRAENGASPRIKAEIRVAGPDPTPHMIDLPGSLPNIPAVEAAAAGVASFSLVPEADGVIRKIPVLLRHGKRLVPALTLEAIRAAQGAPEIEVRADPEGLVSVRTGDVVVPVDSSGQFWLHYSESAPQRAIPAWKVLDKDFPADALKGKIVLLGISATLAQDLHTTPMGAAVPGPDILAQGIEQMLLGRALGRPRWADAAELLALLAAALGLTFLTPRLGAALCAVLALGLCLAFLAASWFGFAFRGLLLDPLFPALGAAAAYLSASLAGFLRTEAERRELLVLDKVKDEFIAMVSHDLRGPVSAMMMVVDMLNAGTYGPVTEKQTLNLKRIKDAGQRLLTFVTNILDAAKIKAGKIEFHMQDLRAAEFVPPLIELFSLSAASRDVVLRLALPDDLPPVRADREKLEQVLNNLIGNALKFTPSGGTITVSAEAQDGLVRFSVRDTGYGIAPEDLPKLFKKFGQVDLASQRSAGAKGTGLGLSICREVVEAHGGKIWVESERNVGSAFLFTVPKA